MPEAKTKADFTAALREAAGNDHEAGKLVELVENRGVEVPLLRHLQPIPRLSREEFEALLAEHGVDAAKKGDLLGIGGPPQTYEEFLRFTAGAERGGKRIPYFRPMMPQDWQQEQLALYPVERDARPYWLPGDNFAGYGDQLEVGVEGVRCACRYVAFTSEPCTLLWLGLAGLQACYVARYNMEADLPPSVEEVRERVRTMVQGDPRQFTDEQLRWQIDGYLLISRLLNRKLRNMLFAVLDTFGIARAEDPFAVALSCLEFLESQLLAEFPPPESPLEDHVRKFLLMHVILVHCLPRAATLMLYGAMPKAAAEPSITLPSS